MAQATFLGHSCVMLTDGEHKIIIDPFLTGNEQASAKPEEIEVSHILVTHGHGDHIGDAVAIAKRTGATIIANFEIYNLVSKADVSSHPLHIGGGADFDFGRVKMTIAHHGGGFGEDRPPRRGVRRRRFYLHRPGGRVPGHYRRQNCLSCR